MDNIWQVFLARFIGLPPPAAKKKKKRDELFLSLHKCMWGWREEELFDDDDVFMQAPDASPPA